jgi:hypothetical protein
VINTLIDSTSQGITNFLLDIRYTAEDACFSSEFSTLKARSKISEKAFNDSKYEIIYISK